PIRPDQAPTQIRARLTWDGTQQGWVTFDTSGLPAGQSFTLTLPVDGLVTASGVDDWHVDVEGGMPDGTTRPAAAARTMPVVAEDSSPYGAGWGIAGIDRLVVGTDANSVLWVTGAGDSRVFTANGDGTYTSPPSDFGALVQNADGSFTYTAKGGTVEQF